MHLVQRGIGASLLLLLVLAGCTHLGEGGERERHRISSAEIETSDARDLYELVERERPRWLETRGARSVAGYGSAQVLVYEEGSRLGGVGELQGMRLDGVAALEYLDGPEASNTLAGIGDDHVVGAIVIRR